MALTDLIFLGLLAVSMLLGLWRGLTYEVLSLLAWGAAALGYSTTQASALVGVVAIVAVFGAVAAILLPLFS